jgi:H+/Cl- antiporter ClcA
MTLLEYILLGLTTAVFAISMRVWFKTLFREEKEQLDSKEIMSALIRFGLTSWLAGSLFGAMILFGEEEPIITSSQTLRPGTLLLLLVCPTVLTIMGGSLFLYSIYRRRSSR